MRQVACIFLCASTVTTSAAAQQTALSADRVVVEQVVSIQAEGQTKVAVEARVTRGAPYSAEAITEFVQVLADGNRIARSTTTRVCRDSDGRTRREEVRDGVVTSIIITDPTEGATLVLNPTTRTATRSDGAFGAVTMVGGGVGGSVGAGVGRGAGRGTGTVVQPAEPATATGSPSLEQRRAIELRTKVEVLAEALNTARGAGQVTRQALGQQTIEGLVANGTRTTTVIPAGQIGNEQPITIVSEQWFSNDLQLLVLTKHSDPRNGETTYRLANITRTEPDRSLFQVPPDYTMRGR